MSRYQPYPNYKESGVEWLGEVPEHWGIKKLKYNLVLQTKKVSTNGHEVIALENIESGSGKYVPTESSYQGEDVEYQAGDILFGKLRPYLAKVYKCTSRGIAFGDLLTYRPNHRFDSEFAFYSLLSEGFINTVDSSTYGAKMPRASSEFINEMHLTIPPLEEQTAIANFLDRETAKIDTLIAKQERMIELLNEKRSALISHAVTKGLNPNAPIKDSGVEWLGEVPEHWEISPLKYLLSESLMYGANESADRDDPNDPRYIRITDIKSDGTLHAHTFKSLPMTIAEPYLLKTGAILLARSGATVGKSFLYDESWGIACFAGYLIKAAINQSKAFARFVYYFTMTPNYWQWLASAQIQATIENVSAEKYASLTIPLPSLSEQENILNYLDTKTTKIDTLIAKACQAIDLMKERRTALISAAVTGKIDVRKIA